MREDSSDAWTVRTREDDLGRQKFRRQWDQFTKDELLVLLEHLNRIESIGPDPESALAVLRYSSGTYILHVERTDGASCWILHAAEFSTRTVTVLEADKQSGAGSYALGERLKREACSALCLTEPEIEFLK